MPIKVVMGPSKPYKVTVRFRRQPWQMFLMY
jgi:hypothetical protein